MRVKHIKFNVVAPKIASTKELNWSLGMGPCGRWVESLKVDITLAVVTVTQTSFTEDPTPHYVKWMSLCTVNRTARESEVLKEAHKSYYDVYGTKEIKTFIYKLEDVRGRIEAIEADRV